MSAGNIEQTASSRASIRPSEVIDDWSASMAFDAAEALDRHPEMANERSVVIDWAFEEYCQRIDRGESIDSGAFAHRFAGVEHSLLGLIQARQFLQENLPVLQGLSKIDWPEVGSNFAGFELIEELGRGAFSRVFVAKERALGGRLVAAKICWRGGDEAMRLGRLEHPGVMPVHSIHQEDDTGLNVIVMPLLSRTTLAGALDALRITDRLPRRAAELWRIVDANNIGDSNGATSGRHRTYRPHHTYETTIAGVGLQLAEALSYAHAHGVIHGDLKPSNVLLLPSGDAVLMDFNLAFDRDEDLQRAGGTLPYMPPELLSRILKPQPATGNGGMLGPDERSDVFSLGATLYECLTGKLPFGTVPEGDRQQIISELLDRQRRGPTPPSELNDRVDPVLDRLIQACLSFEIDNRPASAAEVVAQLRKSLSLRRRVVHTMRRWPRLAAGLCALFVLAVGMTAYTIATLPPYSVRQTQRGWEAELQGDHAAAIAHYNSALEDDPNSLEARFSRACAYLASNKEDDAAEAAMDFKAVYESCKDARAAAGVAYSMCISRELYHNSRVWHERAIEGGMNTPEVLNNFGFCEWRTGHLDEAIQLLRGSIRQNPRSVVALSNLASAEIAMAETVSTADEERPRLFSSSLAHIDAAVALADETGDGSPELRYLAALYHARATRTASLADGPTYFEGAIHYAEQAIDLGLQPKRLELLLQGCRRLAQDERFLRLVNRPQLPEDPPKASRLLNPLSHLRPPYRLDCNSSSTPEK